MKHSHEFIEHFMVDDTWCTDIWYHQGTGKYTSVLSDVFNKEFDKLEDIQEFITRMITEANDE